MKLKPIRHLLLPSLLGASLLTLAGDATKDNVIVQKDRQFSKTEITVKPGEKIVFQNDDEVTHNVFSNSKINAFDLKTQKPGAASEVTFNEEGTTEVRCAIHPKMKVVVTVKK